VKVIVGTATASFAVAKKVTSAPPGAAASTVTSAGQVIAGATVSCTTTESVQLRALPASSVAVARTVWVPGHCYPEFYLEDEDGHGYWIPCQAAGSRAFGSMPDQRPILQKGDSFQVPEVEKPQRYVAEFLKTDSLRGQPPKVKFIRELLPAE
jgi:hypothetical protein